jgi:alpha-glucosidase
MEKIPRGLLLDFTNGKGKVLIYSSKLVRFVITSQEEFDLDYSYAVIKELKDWPESSFEINEEPEKIIIITKDLLIELQRSPYKVLIKENKKDKIVLCEDIDKGMGVCLANQGLIIRSYKKIRENDHFFGFGEKTGPLDKRGESMVMQARDLPYKGNVDPMYQSHPFFISINDGFAYAIFFDNISKTSFDMGKSDIGSYYFDAKTGDLNYYFICGPSIDEILEIYTHLTGHIEMPPKWAIGYHQCRYSYRNEKEIKAITSKFRENKIPCDVIWFDIHYMDGYRCFTFNYNRFPDPKRLIEELKSDGFKPVVIVDPGIKVDEDYKIYQDLIKNKYYAARENGEPTMGIVWPGYTIFPDYTKDDVRNWWSDLHKFYFDLGIDGIWNDMNEPSLSVNPIRSWIKRLHSDDMYLDNQGRNTILKDCKNIYGFCENWATWMAFKKYKPNKRPFILTRSGYSGVQRYAAMWTGDNWTNWTNITLATRMLVNLNLSAQVFCGADIGGHMAILKIVLRDRKQFVRWIQSGVFYPFCRVHATIMMKSQDPFSYGKVVQEISKKYINFRYELLPYWYTLFYNAHKSGEPILRPLFYNTPKDEKCYDRQHENQFFLGKDILIIPINKRRIKNKKIYLPEGEWIHYWTLEEFKGKQEHIIPITLEDLPIFIRKGAIIPMQVALEYVGQKPIDTLILKIYKGAIGVSYSTAVYEDDGESMNYLNKNESCLLELKCEYKETESVLEISEVQGNYKPSWKNIKLIIYENGKIIKEDTENFSEKGMKISF